MFELLLLGAFVALGVVFGWLSWFSTRRLAQQLRQLQLRLDQLEARPDLAVKPARDGDRDRSGNTAVADMPASGTTAAAAPAPLPPVRATSHTSHTSRAAAARGAVASPPGWLQHLREQWMSWLGGICIGLAGIFLVRYSIEQGLLGPLARVVGGLLSGLLLHGVALWLRLQRGAHSALAALAGGGSITLFAALVAGLHLYQLFSPFWAFVLLALVAQLTLWLALQHGPLLAALGLLGAYTVPLLVGGDGQVSLALAYIVLISAASLWLLRYVERVWLWAGILAGCGLWWLLTLPEMQAGLSRGWYLAAVAWLLYAVPDGDWWLQRRADEPESTGWRRWYLPAASRERWRALGLALVLLGFVVSVVWHPFTAQALLQWTPLTALVLLLAGRRHDLSAQAWALPLLTLLAWWLQSWHTPLPGWLVGDFFRYCLLTCVLYVLLLLYNASRGDWRPWLPLLTSVPTGFLVLAWLLAADAVSPLQWLLLAAMLGAVYLALAARALSEGLSSLATAWFFVGAHLAYAVAVALYLREASLTLALAAQVISLAWLIRRFDLPPLGWLLKAVVAVVLCRLSLNPWLEQYPADVHWSLWSYGGATLCCWLGARQLATWPRLRAWTEGATLHLFTLTVWAELRWWLNDGDVFRQDFTALEVGLNTAVFGALALVYHWRERFTEHLARLYRCYSLVLLAMALVCYLLLLQAAWESSAWLGRDVGAARIVNSLWLLFAVPPALALAVARWHLSLLRPAAWLTAALGGFVFINLQIRHFWQGGISLLQSASAAELYTYSAVWLLLAFVALLWGSWRRQLMCYRAGMLLLVVVLGKLFLVDMAGLQGLLRVASFLGMGMALLALAWLHGRLQPPAAVPAPDSDVSSEA